MVVLAIISILGSLSMAGLMVTRQRTKIVRTETTIRKIHEVVMPHYERLISRTIRELPAIPATANPGAMTPSQLSIATHAMQLIARRRIAALELPDGWEEVSNPSTASLTVNEGGAYSAYSLQTAITRRLQSAASSASPYLGDAECLWAAVMRGGFADPGVISHFRADEIGDLDSDGSREFLDAWGKPIRFLRWAPMFVSRYQPAPDQRSQDHDAFDHAGIDPLARCTLFPLIYSGGPDGEPDIFYRDDPLFSYASIAFDPYFAQPAISTYPVELQNALRQWFFPQFSLTEQAAFNLGRPSGSPIPGSHLYIRAGSLNPLAPYESPLPFPRYMAFGLRLKASFDDIHNHSMSR